MPANDVFRDYITDGVSSSGVHKPKKEEIRELLTGYESDITEIQGDVESLTVSVASFANESRWAARGEVAAAQTSALPAHTYANGTLGVGATLTANANGALSNTVFDTVAGGIVLAQRLAVLSEGAKNGIYTVTAVGSAGTPWVLTRATDTDTAAELGFARFKVMGGVTLAGYIYQCQQAEGSITVGTTSLTFVVRDKEDPSTAAEVAAARGVYADLETAMDAKANLDDMGGAGVALKSTRQPTSMRSALILDKDSRKIVAGTDELGRVYFTGGLDPITALKGQTRWNESALSLFMLKAKAVAAGSAVTAKLLIGGDSWTERAVIPQYILDRLTTLYTTWGATGWVSFNGTSADVTPSATSLQPLGACRVTKANWTTADVTEGTASGKYSLDGFRYECATTTGTVAITAAKGTTCYIYYEDTTGTFRYRVDGGSWTTVTGGGTLADTKVTISGLSSGSTHSVDIDTTGNAGTVKIYGAYFTGLTGIEVSKIGNGSLHGLDVPNFMGATGTAQMADIAADGQIIILGTNDVQSGNAVSPLYFKDALTSLHSRLTTASTYAGSLFVLPPDNGGTELFTLADYTKQLKLFAHGENRIGALNLYERWPDYAGISSVVWNDTLHLNTTGAGALADEIMPFLELGN